MRWKNSKQHPLQFYKPVEKEDNTLYYFQVKLHLYKEFYIDENRYSEEISSDNTIHYEQATIVICNLKGKKIQVVDGYSGQFFFRIKKGSYKLKIIKSCATKLTNKWYKFTVQPTQDYLNINNLHINCEWENVYQVQIINFPDEIIESPFSIVSNKENIHSNFSLTGYGQGVSYYYYYPLNNLNKLVYKTQAFGISSSSANMGLIPGGSFSQDRDNYFSVYLALFGDCGYDKVCAKRNIVASTGELVEQSEVTTQKKKPIWFPGWYYNYIDERDFYFSIKMSEDKIIDWQHATHKYSNYISETRVSGKPSTNATRTTIKYYDRHNAYPDSLGHPQSHGCSCASVQKNPIGAHERFYYLGSIITQAKNADFNAPPELSNFYSGLIKGIRNEDGFTSERMQNFSDADDFKQQKQWLIDEGYPQTETYVNMHKEIPTYFLNILDSLPQDITTRIVSGWDYSWDRKIVFKDGASWGGNISPDPDVSDAHLNSILVNNNYTFFTFLQLPYYTEDYSFWIEKE